MPIDLQKLRADYLAYDYDGSKIKLVQEPHSGDHTRIWPSDLGGCPRKVVLRLLDKPKRDLYPSEAIMFWQGNMLHDLTYRALIYAERMISYEERLSAPEGVSGRYDCLWMDEIDGKDTPTLTDIKSVRPNAFQWGELSEDPPRVREYNIPQMGSYMLYGPEAEAHDFDYIDRGGAHGALRLPVTRKDEAKRLAMQGFADIMQVRDAMPEVPAPLEEALVEHWTRHKPPVLKSLGVKQYWACNSLYCRYSGVSCEPRGSYEEICCAERSVETQKNSPPKIGPWKWTPEGKKRREWIEQKIGEKL